MSLRHANLTLSGAAQPLSDALAAPVAENDIPYRQLFLSADDGATNPMFLGGETVTAAIYGIRIPSPAAGVPAVPIVLGPFDSGPVKLSSIYVIGTAGEILNIAGVPY